MAWQDFIGKVGSLAGPISAGVQGVMSAVQLAQSIKQNKEAKAMQSNTIRPIKRVERGYGDNLSLAESRAGQGLSDQSMVVYENNMNRTLTTGVDAILRGAGGVNAISDLYDTAEDNFANLALLEEEIRMKNAAGYMLASEQYAAQEEKAWQVNEYAPYKDRLQAIATLKGQAAQNKSAAFNSFGAGINNFLTGSLYQNEKNKVFPTETALAFTPSSTNPNYQPPAAPASVNAYLRSLSKGINVPGVTSYLNNMSKKYNYSEYIDPINF